MKYTDETNALIVLGLLKAHGIRKVIASPGTTNIALVASMQHDSFFEMYSAADERSAAYMACGLAAESGEAVVLSCTGATASRNYLPALTEAFYRKLPVLAITSTQPRGRVGQNCPQVIDRSVQQRDVVRCSVYLPVCHSKEDQWACNIHVNQAILELFRDGGGPAHIDLETTYSRNFFNEKLPNITPIFRIGYKDRMPELNKKRIGIFVGAHKKWSQSLTKAVDAFCEKHNSVVLCDHTSNYHGKNRVLFSLVSSQDMHRAECNIFDLIINIGNVSGAYPYFKVKEVWRVNPDGEIRDSFMRLKYVFQMEEQYFFDYYTQNRTESDDVPSFLEEWKGEDKKLRDNIGELPFSNIWIAQKTAPKLPQNTLLHLGILNSLRSWNFFEVPSCVEGASNTGGFGIDGIMSAAIGASLGRPQKTVFCIIGDLAFFYDLNSLGNRHVGVNLRILLVNNGKGTEFRNYNHFGAQFGEDADKFISAEGHYGSKSKELVKHFAEDMGFEYLCAENKAEYLEHLDHFVTEQKLDQPIIFEVFTNSEEESMALETIRNLIVDSGEKNKKNVLIAAKKILGEKRYRTLAKKVSEL